MLRAVVNPAVTLRSKGAIANGVTDDTPVIIAAATSAATAGLWLDGEGLTYAVSGDITLPDGARWRNIKLKQLTQSTTRRTIRKIGGSGPIDLRDITVDRNGATTDGSSTPVLAAGVWIESVNDVNLENIEITGNGKGAGIGLLNCTRVQITRPNVHDMRWSNAVDPNTEQVVGLSIENCVDIEIVKPRVRNLDGIIGTNPVRAYQTDGLTLAGCSKFQILGGNVNFVGEGLDISGASNTEGSVVGFIATNCDAFGVKIVNTGQRITVGHSIAIGCGIAGFNASGPSQTGLVGVKNIYFDSCISVNTGLNTNWPSPTTIGFKISQGPITPQTINIRFINCLAIDTQTTPTMQYGFFSEADIDISLPNVAVNCQSIGHSIADFSANMLVNVLKDVVRSRGTTPRLMLDETDAPLDEKLFDIIATGGDIEIRSRTDTDGVGATVATLQRTGTVWDLVKWNATNHQFGGAIAGRSTLFNANGTQDTRFDDNGLVTSPIYRNYGLSAAGQGLAAKFWFGALGVHIGDAVWLVSANTDLFNSTATSSAEYRIRAAYQGVLKDVAVFSPLNGLQVGGPNDANQRTVATLLGHIKPRAYTFATLPAAASSTGEMLLISDRSYRPATSDGTNWRFADGVIVT